mgnify:CR=1 FL=1
MKTIIQSALAAAALLGLAACDLDQTPQSSLTPETSFRSESELQLYVNGLLPSMLTGSTTEKADNGIESTLPTYMTGLRSSTVDPGKWGWNALRSVNILFKYSGNCPDEAVRAKYEAMGHFMRAKFYYEKLKTFGGVPWCTTVLDDNSPELYAPRDSRDVVAENILAELDLAIAGCPTAKSINTITRWSALALKSRFCLFEGTFRRYHGLDGADRYLRECVEASEELMASGRFKIDNTGGPELAYRDLFAQPATGNASDTEVINAEAYDFSLGVKHGFNYQITNPAGAKVGFDRDFICSYLMADGSRFTDRAGYDKMSYADECASRDPRMAQTVYCPGYIQKGDTKTYPTDLTRCPTGYKYIKYVLDVKYNVWDGSLVPLPIFRLAEVYLNYAEALAELDKLTQDAADASVNKLRDRVGMPHLDVAAANANPDPYMMSEATGYPNVTRSASTGVILEVRRERLIELVLEGLHYNDILRWREGKVYEKPFYGQYFPGEGRYDLTGDGRPNVCLYTGKKPSGLGLTFLKLGEDIKLSEGTSGYMIVHDDEALARNWNETRDYLYAIPINERLLTGGALSQNPGWNDGLSY